ncbi:hypothetical protein ACLOJK_003764 [Asimina triloba]
MHTHEIENESSITGSPCPLMEEGDAEGPRELGEGRRQASGVGIRGAEVENRQEIATMFLMIRTQRNAWDRQENTQTDYKLGCRPERRNYDFVFLTSVAGNAHPDRLPHLRRRQRPSRSSSSPSSQAAPIPIITAASAPHLPSAIDFSSAPRLPSVVDFSSGLHLPSSLRSVIRSSSSVAPSSSCRQPFPIFHSSHRQLRPKYLSSLTLCLAGRRSSPGSSSALLAAGYRLPCR